MPEVYYRYEPCTFEFFDDAKIDFNDLDFQMYEVVETTPTGVILDNYGERKNVQHSWKKKFAYPTRREAFDSFFRRKRRQIEICTAQIARAQLQMQKANEREKEYGFD